MPVAAVAQSAYTPAPGSSERRAIMDAMRAKGDDRDRAFVVRHLKVSGAWAWLEADPQSRSGSNKYESESALLRRSGSGWSVVAQPCAEEGCDPRRELRRIRTSFPAAPASIFRQ